MEKLLTLSPPDKYGQNGDSPKISSLQKDETVPYLVQGPFVRFNNNQITNETKSGNNL